jgi:hypothetical protein
MTRSKKVRRKLGCSAQKVSWMPCRARTLCIAWWNFAEGEAARFLILLILPDMSWAIICAARSFSVSVTCPETFTPALRAIRCTAAAASESVCIHADECCGVRACGWMSAWHECGAPQGRRDTHRVAARQARLPQEGQLIRAG